MRCVLGRLPPEAALLAAVSGGADSCALLASAARVRGAHPLFCVHVVHGLRSASEGEADSAHVADLCRRLDVPFETVRLPDGAVLALARKSGRGVEDAARRFRQDALRKAADRVGSQYILLGHTDDDLLETAIMRFLRGSGPAGLAAMPVSRGRIIRPLLQLSRNDVLGYLQHRGIAYREDSTNADLSYLRNRIRHRLVPLLDAEFPSWRSGIRGAARIQSDAARFIAGESTARLPWTRSSLFPGSLEIDEVPFFSVDPLLRTEAVYAALNAVLRDRNGDIRTLSADERARKDREPARRAIERFVCGESAAQNIGKVRLVRQNGRVAVHPIVFGGGEEGFSLTMAELGIYRIPVLGIAVSLSAQAGAEAVAVSLPALFRSARSSESALVRPYSGSSGAGAIPVSIVEDSSGIAGFVSRGESGSWIMHSAPKKRPASDYARAAFFSIL